jgi:hypothetical protein
LRVTLERLTLSTLCDWFLTTNKGLADPGELSGRSFADYTAMAPFPARA